MMEFKIVPVAIGATVVLTITFGCTQNALVRRRNRCAHAASGVDVQLRKRHDLIPGLVSTLKNLKEHERHLVENLTRLHVQLAQLAIEDVKRLPAEQSLGRAMGQILNMVEAYPELRTARAFLQFQRALTELEEQISASRRFYNTTVEEYNNLVQGFPSMIVAGLLGYKPRPFFEALEWQRSAVPVALGAHD